MCSKLSLVAACSGNTNKACWHCFVEAFVKWWLRPNNPFPVTFSYPRLRCVPIVLPWRVISCFPRWPFGNLWEVERSLIFLFCLFFVIFFWVYIRVTFIDEAKESILFEFWTWIQKTFEFFQECLAFWCCFVKMLSLNTSSLPNHKLIPFTWQVKGLDGILQAGSVSCQQSWQSVSHCKDSPKVMVNQVANPSCKTMNLVKSYIDDTWCNR